MLFWCVANHHQYWHIIIIIIIIINSIIYDLEDQE